MQYWNCNRISGQVIRLAHLLMIRKFPILDWWAFADHCLPGFGNVGVIDLGMRVMVGHKRSMRFFTGFKWCNDPGPLGLQGSDLLLWRWDPTTRIWFLEKQFFLLWGHDYTTCLAWHVASPAQMGKGPRGLIRYWLPNCGDHIPWFWYSLTKTRAEQSNGVVCKLKWSWSSLISLNSLIYIKHGIFATKWYHKNRNANPNHGLPMPTPRCNVACPKAEKAWCACKNQDISNKGKKQDSNPACWRLDGESSKRKNRLVVRVLDWIAQRKEK